MTALNPPDRIWAKVRGTYQTLPGRSSYVIGSFEARPDDKATEYVRGDLAPAWNRDMSAAPRDGTLIDLFVGGEFARRITDVSWREPTDSEWWVHGGDTIQAPDATWHDGFGPLDPKEPILAWMPLPKHPDNEAANG